MSGNQISDVNLEEIGQLFGTSFMSGLKLPAKPKEGGRVIILDKPPNRIDLKYVQQNYKNAVRVYAEGKAFGVNLGLGKVFSHFDFGSYGLNSMEIDHLVPCAEVNKRVGFIVDLLNENCDFAKGFMQAAHGDFPDISMDKFFKKERSIWYPTLYLYVCFYSNILNTQLLPSDVNRAKSDTEFFEFLCKQYPHLLEIFNQWLKDNDKEVRNGLTGPFVVDKNNDGLFIKLGGKPPYDKLWATDSNYQHILEAFLLALEKFSTKMAESILRLEDATVANVRQKFLNNAQGLLNGSGQKADNFAKRLMLILPALKILIEHVGHKVFVSQEADGTPETFQEAMALGVTNTLTERVEASEFFKVIIKICENKGLNEIAQLLINPIFYSWPAEDAKALRDWFTSVVETTDPQLLKQDLHKQVIFIIKKRNDARLALAHAEFNSCHEVSGLNELSYDAGDEETGTEDPNVLLNAVEEEEEYVPPFATAFNMHTKCPHLSQASSSGSQPLEPPSKRTERSRLSSSSERSRSSSLSCEI